MIVGVSGGSGSGKTTIVNMLREHYGASELLVLHMDHYYRDFSAMSPAERDAINFDHPQAFDWRLLQRHLASLKQNKPIDRPTYDFKTHTRTADVVTLVRKEAVVVEGILTLHDEPTRALFDLSVFVDVPDDLRFIRRLKRDIADRGRSLESVVDQYLETVRPMHSQFIEPQRHLADIIIGWHDVSNKAVQMLARALAPVERA